MLYRLTPRPVEHSATLLELGGRFKPGTENGEIIDFRTKLKLTLAQRQLTLK